MTIASQVPFLFDQVSLKSSLCLHASCCDGVIVSLGMWRLEEILEDYVDLFLDRPFEYDYLTWTASTSIPASYSGPSV